MFCNRTCKSRSEWSSILHTQQGWASKQHSNALKSPRSAYVCCCMLHTPNGVANCDLPQPMIGYYLHLFAKSPTKQLHWHKKFHSIRALGLAKVVKAGLQKDDRVEKHPFKRWYPFNVATSMCKLIINRQVVWVAYKISDISFCNCRWCLCVFVSLMMFIDVHWAIAKNWGHCPFSDRPNMTQLQFVANYTRLYIYIFPCKYDIIW